MDICILCKSSKKDDVLYGEFLKKNKIGVHTYCLYLSSNLSQNGADDEGFLGFLEADIKKEVSRISQLRCFYCRKSYANIGCCASRCRRTFHFICGLENDCENQFCHDFRSYCNRDLRKVTQRPASKETCLICYENLRASGEKFNALNMIQAPCCRNGWFHKLCLQKFAKTAGYFFKCPLCNDAKVFREKLPAKGIFIPNQDAAWELEPNAFAELLERPSECAAIECKNKKGRKSMNDNNPFVMCSTCGSTAMHRLCLPNGAKQFHCADCTIAIQQDDSGRDSLNSQINQRHDEDEEVDVCNVSDDEDLLLVRGLGDRRTCVGQKRSVNSKSGRKSKSKRYRSDHSSDNYSDKDYTASSSEEEEEEEEDTFMETSFNSNNKSDKSCSINSISSEESNNSVRKTDKQCTITSISSDESIINTSRKRILTIISDSEDEQQVSSKTKRSNVRETKARPRCEKTSTSEANDSDVVEVISTKNSSILTDGDDDDDDDDDDPLENFTKIIERQKNISCIALRTRRRSQYLESPQDFLTISDSQEFKSPANNTSSKPNDTKVQKKDDKARTSSVTKNVNRSTDCENKSATSHCKPLKNDTNTNSKQLLDGSFIAKRTRRKSMACMPNNHSQKENLDKNSNTNTSNGASKAVHTRRRTICASSAKERCQEMSKIYENLNDDDEISNKPALNVSRCPAKSSASSLSECCNQEMSQIYEKLQESDEDKAESDEPYDCETDQQESDLDDDFVTPDEDTIVYSPSSDEDYEIKKPYINDCYPNNNNNLELSCIANRTRKRKSLKHSRKAMERIDEDSTCSSSSATSATSTLSFLSNITSSTSLTTKSTASSTSSSLHNVNAKKRRSLRISSSEDSEPTKSSYTTLKTKTPSPYLETFPPRNLSVFLNHKYVSKSSLNSASNYYPNNQYHPHCNNHRRV